MASSIVDSVAVFKARVTQIGLPETVFEGMVNKGWSTFTTFSFSSTYVPGASDDSAFLDKVVVPLLGERDHKDTAKLRRLVYESYTLMAGELRSKADRSGEDQPRKLPLAERAARHKKLVARLSGLPMEGAWEPSHHLVDLMSSMVEDGAIRYVQWSDCVSREDEVRGQKKTKEWKPGANGILREISSKEPVHKADTSSDLKLWQALHRRGAAAELGGLMTYESHDLLVKTLITELQKPPPSGFLPISHEQLQRADVEAWKLLAAETTGGLGPDPSGALPADTAMRAIVNASSVRLLLLPLQGSSKKSASPAKDAPPAKKPRPQPRSKATSAPRRQVPLPSGLEGSSRTSDGASICFGFNLGTCKGPSKGCPRGKHVCTKCFGDHPFSKCRSQ